MLADRLAEGLAHLRIGHRILQRGAGNAHAARRNVDTPQFQAAEHLLQTPALDATDEVVGRHAVVIEHELRGIDALVAEFLEFSAVRKPRPLLADEGAHALVARIGL